MAEGEDTLWDSGRVASSATRSTSPTPAGRCRRGAEFVWTVQVWDEAGAASDWSEPARFRTGLAGWSAQWIGRDRIHDPADGRAGQRRRHGPAAAHAARPARTCAGRSTLSRRGAPSDALRHRARRGRAGAERHARRRQPCSRRAGRTTGSGSSTRRTTSPSSSATATTCSARSSGRGGTPASSASTRCGAATTTASDPALLCELHLEHEDGSVEVIASDAEWRATTGPIEYSDLLMGERYDARRELGAVDRR